MGMIRKAQPKKVMALCMMVVCCMTGLFGQKAYAAPGSNPVILPGTQTFTKPDASAVNDTFVYTLTAKETGNPMPSGSSDGVYTFTASGTGGITIGAIAFTQSGTYHYEAAQSVASPKKGYSYDTQVYAITIYINTDLEADIIIKNEAGAKTEGIRFENQYAPMASDPSVTRGAAANGSGKNGATTNGPKTGDDSMTELYQALLFSSCLVLMACMVFLGIKRKNRRNGR